MARGIDLSIPAVITLSSTIVLGFSGGHDEAMLAAVCRGAVLRHADRIHQRATDRGVRTQCPDRHPRSRRDHGRRHAVVSRRASAGSARASGNGGMGRCAVSSVINVSVWVVAALAIILNLVLRKTTIGRHFSAVGANPRAAWIAGIQCRRLPNRSIRRRRLPLWRCRNPGLGVHPQPDTEGRRALSAGADRGRRSWRYRDVGRHRQHGCRCRRRAVSHPTRARRCKCWACPRRCNSSSRVLPSRLAWLYLGSISRRY